jgi:hypothetical protein
MLKGIHWYTRSLPVAYLAYIGVASGLGSIRGCFG